MRTDQMARAAGRLAGRWLPAARSAANAARSEATKRSGKLGDQFAPAARQSGMFVKHVLPAVAKPIHSLWHQLLGFIFLAFAGLCAWKVWSNQATIAPPIFALAIVFIVVMAGYGIASLRKSQRISRS